MLRTWQVLRPTTGSSRFRHPNRAAIVGRRKRLHRQQSTVTASNSHSAHSQATTQDGTPSTTPPQHEATHVEYLRVHAGLSRLSFIYYLLSFVIYCFIFDYIISAIRCRYCLFGCLNFHTEVET